MILLVLSPCAVAVSFVKKPVIVASIKPVALLVEAVAGDDFEVRTLLPASANPHALAMSMSDRQLLEQAALVVWLGPSFERFLEKPLQGKQNNVVLGQAPNLLWPGDEGADLHLWLNARNAAVAIEAIAQQLIALEPLAAIAIQERLVQAKKRLLLTDVAIKKLLAPVAHEPFGVSHDAFGHFVAAYGLKQLAAASQLPEQQLSARKLFMLQRELAGAKCLITEPNDHAAVKLAATLKLPTESVDPLARASSITSIDALLLAVANGFKRCLTLPRK